ncbi:putative membrane protein [Oxalobacteraceae bacterium GrIS 2.11]
MTEAQMLTVSYSLVAGLFFTLAAIIGWIGTRMMNKMDEMNHSIIILAGDLHTRINSQDTRLTRVEVRTERLNDVLFQRSS